MKFPVKRMKRQVTNWQKIFANHIFDKELVSKIHKVFSKVNSAWEKKKSNSIRKWAHAMKKDFTKEDTQMSNYHMRRCSTSLAMKGMQIKISS